MGRHGVRIDFRWANHRSRGWSWLRFANNNFKRQLLLKRAFFSRGWGRRSLCGPFFPPLPSLIDGRERARPYSSAEELLHAGMTDAKFKLEDILNKKKAPPQVPLSRLCLTCSLRPRRRRRRNAPCCRSWTWPTCKLRARRTSRPSSRRFPTTGSSRSG